VLLLNLVVWLRLRLLLLCGRRQRLNFWLGSCFLLPSMVW
jgi:hypothetical protein